MVKYIPYGWNTDSVRIDNLIVKSLVSIGWRNFRKNGMSWTAINTDISPDFSVSSFPASIEFAKKAKGWSEVLFDSSFSVKRHIEEPNTEAFNSEPEFSMSLKVETDRNVSGRIDEDNPNSIIYENAWDGANLRMGLWRGATTRIEKVVEVLQEPIGVSEFIEYSFLLRSKGGKFSRKGGLGKRVKLDALGDILERKEERLFMSLGDSELRGTILNSPVCWWYDSEGEIVKKPIKIIFQPLGNNETIRCTKYIPRAYIREALEAGSYLRTDATFTPDADPETASMDFWTQRSVANQTWSGLSTGNGNGASASNTSGYIRMRSDTTTNRYNLLNRANFFFDTSSLSGLVTDATLKFYIFSSADPNPPLWSSAINIYGSSSTNTTAPATSDFQAVQSTPLATAISAGSLNTSGYNTFTLNTSGKAAVDTAGLSKFVAILSTYDLNVSTPTWSSNKDHNYRNYYAENGASTSPELEVTTTPIVNTANPAFMLLLT